MLKRSVQLKLLRFLTCFYKVIIIAEHMLCYLQLKSYYFRNEYTLQTDITVITKDIKKVKQLDLQINYKIIEIIIDNVKYIRKLTELTCRYCFELS